MHLIITLLTENISMACNWSAKYYSH